MAKSTNNKNLLALNDMTNLHVKVKKDGTRRLVGHVSLEIGDALEECQTPAAVGEFALSKGLRLEEILDRAGRAPNFGQFRMVIGNRLRGIEQRIEAKGMTREQAAYPKEYAKAKREEAKAARAAAKAEKKTPKKEPASTPAKTPKKVIKKVEPKKGAKADKPKKGIKVLHEDGTLTMADGSPVA